MPGIALSGTFGAEIMQQPFGAALAATLLVVLFALAFFLEAVDFLDREADEALCLFAKVPPI
jgi:hypothetical protein